MTLKDKIFQNDTIVQTRDGELWLVVCNGEILLRENIHNGTYHYEDDLTHFYDAHNDIINAWRITSYYGYTNLCNLLTMDFISRMCEASNMEELEVYTPKELTVKEIEDILGYPIKIVK